MDEKKHTEVNDQPSEQHEVVFTYLKSNLFRVIHADGAWGGLSARGDIHISFYNERAAIPDTSKIVVSEKTGAIVKPEEFQSSSKFVREVEADVIVDLGTAISLRDWLNNKISALEKLIREAQNEEVRNADEKTTNGKH